MSTYFWLTSLSFFFSITEKTNHRSPKFQHEILKCHPHHRVICNFHEAISWGNIKKYYYIVLFYVPLPHCKVRIIQHKKLMTTVRMQSPYSVQIYKPNIGIPMILVFYHPLELSSHGTMTSNCPAPTSLQQKPASFNWCCLVQNLIAVVQEEAQGYFWPCQLLFLIHSISSMEWIFSQKQVG